MRIGADQGWQIACLVEHEADAIGLGARAVKRDQRFKRLAQIEDGLLDLHLAGLDLGDIEHVVQQGHQHLAAVVEHGDMALLLFCEAGALEQMGCLAPRNQR